ncbi:MAG: 50S ribosomal protein L24 [Bradymonadaceae bacterium]|nr:50S ribosomal protein L24 [Lujinxingiaceae bacterium]
MHVKKNDKVIILTGKDRNLTGEIIDIDLKKGRVKVARRNMIVKHKKPSPTTGEAGARIDQENWINASNVALFSEKTEGPVRTSARWKGKGGELFASRKDAALSFGQDAPERITKVRYAKKTEEVFD